MAYSVPKSIKENDQHLVQLLPNMLVTPFITVLLVSINVFGDKHLWQSFLVFNGDIVPVFNYD